MTAPRVVPRAENTFPGNTGPGNTGPPQYRGPVSIARAERLVNLVLALLSTRQYLTAERVRNTVAGYSDAASDEAFSRMFERDKRELRELGIPLETGRNSVFDAAEGYRIARRDYELGGIDLAPAEATAVGLAARFWDAPELAEGAQTALVKLRAAGVDVDAAPNMAVQPRVRTEPAFSPLLTAVREGTPVRFEHRRAGSPQRRTRLVEPWGVVSWRARWYLVGHDRERAAPRCFRLSRIVGEVRTAGNQGEIARPSGLNLLEFVAGSGETAEQSPPVTVRLWLAKGRALGIRRWATVEHAGTIGGTPGDVVRLEVSRPDDVSEWFAGYGPDVVVLEPDTLAKSVCERWQRVLHEGCEQ